MKIYQYDTIDSTNSEAKRLIQSGGISLPAAIIANRQTAGRGRLGRSFYSPPASGIYMSIVMDFPQRQEDGVLITVRTSVAAAEAIQEITGIEVGIKWVNDLYINDKKICGILTESALYEEKRYVIIGIGINITTDDFPDELAKIAGSLGPAARGCNAALTDAVIRHVLRISEGGARYIEEYKKRSIVIGKMVSYRYNGVQYEGRVTGIAEDGALLIDLGGGKTDLLRSGEISLKPLK